MIIIRKKLAGLLSVAIMGCFSSVAHADEKALPQALLDVKKLASEEMAGRATDSHGGALARDYIIARLQQLGLTACGKDFVQEFEFQTRQGVKRTGRNILACRPGSLKEHESAPMLLISAHYDHLGEREGKIYYGADDNASGVAAVLAIATAMQDKSPQHDVLYAFFDAEELGLAGSHAFAAKPVVDMQRIGMNINFDMVARGDKGELYASGTYHTPALKNLLAPLDGTQGVKLMFGHDRPEQKMDDWTRQSDHFPFFQAGVPHIYFGVEDHADYHQPGDTADKINPQFYLGTIELLTKASYILDQKLLDTDFRIKGSK